MNTQAYRAQNTVILLNLLNMRVIQLRNTSRTRPLSQNHCIAAEKRC